jgi:Mrp family chromosome partitioning ATPase
LDADITGPAFQGLLEFRTPNPGVHSSGLNLRSLPAGEKIVSINMFLPNEDDPVVRRRTTSVRAVKQFYEIPTGLIWTI